MPLIPAVIMPCTGVFIALIRSVIPLQVSRIYFRYFLSSTPFLCFLFFAMAQRAVNSDLVGRDLQPGPNPLGTIPLPNFTITHQDSLDHTDSTREYTST